MFLNTALVVGAFCFLLFTPANLLQGMSLLHHCAVVGAGTLSLIVWWLARNRSKWASPFVYIIANLILLDVMYFTNAGSMGSLVWILPLVLIFAVMLLRGWRRFCAITLYALNLPFIFLAEIYFPEWVVPYPEEWARLLDLMLSAPIAAMLTGFLMASYSHALDEERRRSAEHAQRLRELVIETGHLALTDGLTGLWNQRALRLRLREEMAESIRHDHRLSLLILDLDHFKAINDFHGHQAGDAAISRVAGYIHKSVRKDDIAGRYGGEEFLLILPNVNAKGAAILAEKIRARVEMAERKGPTPFTLSAGVAERCGEDDPEQLFRRADRALYQAKQTGRNRVVIAEPKKPDKKAEYLAEPRPADPA